MQLKQQTSGQNNISLRKPFVTMRHLGMQLGTMVPVDSFKAFTVPTVLVFD